MAIAVAVGRSRAEDRVVGVATTGAARAASP